MPAGCRYCRDQEEQGLESLRLQTLKEYPIPITKTKIVSIEVFPSNVCNLRCIMCSPNFSSALGAEYQKLNWIADYTPIDHSDKTLDILNELSDLETIGFIGGEFFLTKCNLEILDIIINKKLRAKIITNATVITDAHLDKLKQIEDLDIQISIDGVGSIYEFIRYPAQWADVETNITKLKKNLPNAKIHFSAVVQPLTFQYLIKLIDYANQRIIPLNLSDLNGPNWLSWSILTNNERTLLINDFNAKLSSIRITKDQKTTLAAYEHVLSTTNFNPLHRQEFVDRFTKIIQNRKIDYQEVKQILGVFADII
jgi:molybdenum cofactor biosynthesis enzyme MoaA